MALEHNNLNIPSKANRILNLILIAIALIILRIWHLAVIQYDEKLEESRKPQRRTLIEPSKRATIRDRFNIPLAMNRISYKASILYSQLRHIPSVVWEKGADGKKTKKFKRKEYISRLSLMLADELQLDAERLEDLIHAKASLYYGIPFVIKEDLTESEYYRLKIREKDWLGLQVQISPRRYYPMNKIGADVIGYMGAINRQEYESILQQIKSLQTYLNQNEEGIIDELPMGIASEAQARKRLQELQGYAYTINDHIGKAGIEGRFEQDLRGFHGRKTFYSDARGNFLRELPGAREPLPGQRFLLTLSVELQEYCEKLLAQNEKIREARPSGPDAAKHALLSLRQPWIKGGAIIAMEPKTGEILAMASYPRFDPNDFIATGSQEINKQRRSNIGRWFESESYLGEIWDQKRPLEREAYDDRKGVFFDEKLILTWDAYLKRILPKTNPAAESLSRMNKISDAIDLQNQMEALHALGKHQNIYWILNMLYREEGHLPYGAPAPSEVKKELDELFKTQQKQFLQIKKKLDRYFGAMPKHYDKVLLADLCRVAVDPQRFDPKLLEKAGRQSLDTYRDANAAKVAVAEEVRSMAKVIFHAFDFKKWRQENEKDFLKNKRIEEKEAKQYPKPYIDYLDAKENELFQTFWEQHGYECMLAFISGKSSDQPELAPYLSHFIEWHDEFSKGAHQEVTWKPSYLVLQKAIAAMEPSLAISYLKSLRGYEELNRPLLGRYRHIRKQNHIQLEKNLAAAFYPLHGFGYGRSHAYRQAASQGSIFKLVTAYAALKQQYESLKDESITVKKLNPFEMIDHTHKEGKELYLGYHADGKPLPRIYKGGRLLRSTHVIGKVDLLRALEHSSNPYFSLLAGDFLKSPEDLEKAARQFVYGSCTGIDLPAEIAGSFPDDLGSNRTGLYATANGQHTLVVTPLQTSVMLSALANGGQVLKPKIVKLTAGRRLRLEEGPKDSQTKCGKELGYPGADLPLLAELGEDKKTPLVCKYPTIVRREVFLPEIIRKILLEGMRRVVIRTQEESLPSLSKIYREHPEAISDYIELKDELVGKTSTAESMENIDMDIDNGTNLYTHVWFGGISFSPEFKEMQQQKFVFNNKFGEPELVVVVYFRYGTYGKEAAPVAAQVVKEWREIKKSAASEKKLYYKYVLKNLSFG